MQIYQQVLTRKCLTSTARTNGTANGDGIDRIVNGNPFHSAIFAILTATLTDGVHTITVQESDDNSTFTDAPAAMQTAAVATVAGTDNNKAFELGYHGNRRYCRLKVVTSGSTTGGVVGAVCILGEPRNMPVR